MHPRQNKTSSLPDICAKNRNNLGYPESQQLTLLLSVKECANILGFSMKNALFGFKDSENQAYHKQYDRTMRSGRISKKALIKMHSFIAQNHGVEQRKLNLDDDTLILGDWMFAKVTIRENAPRTYETLHEVLRASNSLQRDAHEGGMVAFANKLRMVTDTSALWIWRDCAQNLFTINSSEFERVMAPLRVFHTIMLMYIFIIETLEDEESAVTYLNALTFGHPGLRGPRYAIGRWVDDARKLLRLETRTALFDFLSINPSKNQRTEWTKIANGRARIPPLSRLRQDLERGFHRSRVEDPDGELLKQLDARLCHAVCVAKAYEYLRKHNVTKARKVLLTTVSDINSERRKRLLGDHT